MKTPSTIKLYHIEVYAKEHGYPPPYWQIFFVDGDNTNMCVGNMVAVPQSMAAHLRRRQMKGERFTKSQLMGEVENLKKKWANQEQKENESANQ